MALVSGLRALGRDAWLYADRLIDAAHFDRNWIINETDLPNMQWECIVLDRFQTSPEELSRWNKLAPVIGIDEGGVNRNYFDFLIDILPGCHRSAANIADVSLLPLPEKLVSKIPHTEDCCPADSLEDHGGHGGKKRILISFGQEDAAGLGLAVAEALTEQNSGAADITLLWGGLHKSSTPQYPVPSPQSPVLNPHLKMVEIIPDLGKHLNNYDLVITHYGITAFEALYMGVPVLLVSPSPYHEKLAKAAGFYSLGGGIGIPRGKAAIKKLGRLLCNKGAIERLKDRCAALAVKHNLDHTPRKNFANFINNITPNVSRNCPACGAALHGPAIARYAERTYFRCARCGIVAMQRLTPPPIEYGKEYFFELYQKQYGKTYIEDFPNLTAMAKRRLAVIRRLSPKSISRRTRSYTEHTEEIQGFAIPRLLDIGCAYGPFLAAAREEGFSPCGIDPAEDAVRYVTETLGIPAVQGFFPLKNSTRTGERVDELEQYSVGQEKAAVSIKSEGPPSPYSVITLWYVMEHFRDCVPVLAEIRKLLKSGGVLAFATPSFTGISSRASLKKFLERSPADHWTVWSPASAKKVLKTAGFTVKKIINSGHHPERFPVLGKFARGKKSPLYWLLLAISKIFSLSDTFEVYAVI